MGGLKPYLNIDADGDGKADYNIDTNGDGIPDKNLLDNNNDNETELKKNLGGANTGDNTKWVWWWIMLILTTITMMLTRVKQRNSKRK